MTRLFVEGFFSQCTHPNWNFTYNHQTSVTLTQCCEKYLPHSRIVLHICHNCTFQLIKQILMLDKDNTRKSKMQFLNKDFIYKQKKAIQIYLDLCKKKWTGGATLGSKNCNPVFCDNWQWVFLMAVDEFSPAWMACLRSCQSISIGFKTGLRLGHSETLFFVLFFSAHSEVDLLVWFGTLFCCIIPMHLSFRVWTDGWILSFRIFL